ncbi:hypothetical protein ACJX0J_034753, partial [Zea mays]
FVDLVILYNINGIFIFVISLFMIMFIQEHSGVDLPPSDHGQLILEALLFMNFLMFIDRSLISMLITSLIISLWFLTHATVVRVVEAPDKPSDMSGTGLGSHGYAGALL